MRLAVNFQTNLSSEPWGADRHELMRRAIQIHARWYSVLVKLESPLLGPFRERYTDAGIADLIGAIADDLDGESGDSTEPSIDGLMTRFSAAAPSDIGPTRTFSWSAFGVSWLVSCTNDEESVIAAERFCATAQIILADLGNSDLLFLLNKVEIEVEVRDGDVEVEMIDFRTDDPVGRWAVRLSRYEYSMMVDESNHRELIAEITTCVWNILSELSAHQASKVEAVFQRLGAGGLFAKLVAGRPYDELVAYMPSEYWPGAAGYGTDGLPLINARGSGNEMLPPESGDAEDYNRDRALELANNRYRNAPKMIPITLKRALADPNSRNVLARLRSSGWLDWHLLTALANLSVNYRWVNDLPVMASGGHEELNEIARRPETEDDPKIPLDNITEKSLSECLQVSAFATLQVWEKCANHPYMPASAALGLLAQRFRFWTDDVEHDPLDLGD
jgi:hypothetical protein